MMKMERRSLAILLALLLALGLIGCGANSKSASAVPQAMNNASSGAAASDGGYWREEVEFAADAPMAPEPGTPQAAPSPSRSDGPSLPDGVKMIYTANMDLETTEFDRAAEDIRTLTQSLGGYFEEKSTSSASANYRRASYTVRVPAENFEEFLRQAGSLCHVSYQSQSAEDVSERYYDMESRLETAKIKLERLQDLLSRAELMEDIITLENAISETEYQIESLSGSLRHYDALIGYSTIYVSLSEVYRVTETEPAPLTFGERMGSAFRDGWSNFVDGLEDCAEWFAYSWTSLLIFVAFVAIVVLIIRKLLHKRSARKMAAAQWQQPQYQPPQQPQPPQENETKQ